MAVINLFTFSSPTVPDEWHGIGAHRSWVVEDYGHCPLWRQVPDGWVEGEWCGFIRRSDLPIMGRTNGKSVPFEHFNETNHVSFWPSWR